MLTQNSTVDFHEKIIHVYYMWFCPPPQKKIKFKINEPKIHYLFNMLEFNKCQPDEGYSVNDEIVTIYSKYKLILLVQD